MNLKATSILVFFFCISASLSSAQSHTTKHKINMEVPEVALLGIVSDESTNVTLNSSVPTEAGTALNFNNAQNSSIWLNYSSVVAKKDQKRKVVGMIQGELPKGIKLVVEASEYTGSGKGKTGEPVEHVQLSDQPKDVILDIGSCYTGKGTSNGHYLTYKIEFDNSSDNYAALAQQQNSINVIYTLTDIN